MKYDLVLKERFRMFDLHHEMRESETILHTFQIRLNKSIGHIRGRTYIGDYFLTHTENNLLFYKGNRLYNNNRYL